MVSANSQADVRNSQMGTRTTHLTGDATHLQPKNILTSFRKTHSKSVGHLLESREPTDAPRRNILMTTDVKALQKTRRHSGGTPQNKALTTLHKERRHSGSSISGAARFYANVITQYDSQNAADNGGTVEPAYLRIRRTAKNMTIACISLVFWLTCVLFLAIYQEYRG